MLLNVHKHKVNCFHRSVNQTMIDSCQKRHRTIELYQTSLSNILISIKFSEAIYIIVSIFSIIQYFHVKTKNYLHIHYISISYHKVHITMLTNFSGSAKYHYLCGYWYFAERNGTASNMKRLPLVANSILC